MLALQATVQIKGPPAGPASGRYDVPRPVVGGVGALIVVVGLGYLVARLRRGRR